MKEFVKPSQFITDKPVMFVTLIENYRSYWKILLLKKKVKEAVKMNTQKF
jgi:hypothetical protein